MADCSTLLDEALESFVFSYLTDSPVPGEESLSLDFPEIDLSQLDAGDFDTTSCFNELQWCNDQSENESSQYSTDDSELFQIDGENEALLAALTQTLDDIQEDDINLSAFMSSGDGDFYPVPALSPKPSRPTEFPKSLETEDELSILKKLLLSPAQTPTGSDAHESSSRQKGTSKVRLQRQCLKVDSSQEKPTSIPQAQGRSCSELHRHLVSITHVPPPTAKDESNKEVHDSVEEENSEDESGSSSPLYAFQGQDPQFTCEKEKNAVVDLIRYMHTYCLPLKKHHSDEKHQQSSSLLKRTKSDSTQAVHTYGNKVNLANAKGNCLALGMLKRTKRTWSGSSILKELLARDICEDVSKPYRLVQPVYAAFSHLSCSRLPQDKIEGRLNKGIKPALEKTEKVYLALKKDGQCTGADAAQEQMTSKSASKQECSVYVRRSSRLNPEFWFNDETSPQTCTARTDSDSQHPAAQNLCLTVEPFVDEEQVAEIEVGESTETNGQTELDRALQDLDSLQSDALEAHTDIANQPYHPPDNTCRSSLSLTETNSPFEKRTFEEGLTVELCGTAGLTPPTTPPYKPAEEDLYKPEISQESVNKGSLITLSLKEEASEVRLSVNRKLAKKQPERTELYAHLSRTQSVPANSPSQGIKRTFFRSFGDHDYCQVNKSETVFQRKILKPLDLPNHGEKKKKQPEPPVLQRKVTEGALTQDTKVLKDHEIRASLTKHFGFPDSTLKEEEDNVTCINPEYDSVFEDSDSDCSSPDEACLSPLRAKSCSRRSPQSKPQSYRQGQAAARIISSSDSKRTHRCESNEQRPTGNLSQRQIQRKRQNAIDEGRLICIRNLSGSISANELKRRFEVFGEMTECLILSRRRGEKYGLITYRFHEDAALSLKKGPSLRKRNEPLFQMSYGGLGHFFWTKYTDLDSNAAEPSTTVMKSKYKSMDFDSLLKEAQRSLHR
ncbi:peroxisome proliferator-activated receptor gamma coactivator 1-beta isoform X2 [Hyla sarda]|uniref:peroxisome proliferator-activated receptor gamma coactivator 1-beta isoform X2 n=1 Tax=Hyla sarda TaxID=327740 RepID=UPI0024C32666|nr:peroxisome proliferator-activated receptor gamma coactivator 1-beta isoform X2 [Hyla sarda]